MNYLVTYAILAAVAILIARAERRRADRGLTALSRALTAHDQYERDLRDLGEDTLDALIRATREQPHETHAWEPADLASSIRRLPLRIALDDCGCIWFDGGWWSPCAEHDVNFELSQMEREPGQ